MDRAKHIWAGLGVQGKVLLLGSLFISVLLLGLMLRLAFTPNYGLLYSGLEPSAADQVLSRLEADGVAYDVRGDAIYVPQAQRDRLRLQLASQGVPQAGGAGYELLDGLSGFGTTTAMFDAAYWRAKEGELARTILASQGVRAARVHIAREDVTAFASTRSVTAAVTVTMDTPPLPQRQAEAIRFLVASSVPGLAPAAVSVIDSDAGIILHPGDDETRQVIDPFDERAAQLKANIERLLTARVGQGRAFVEVMIDADLDSETVTERVLDPNRRVAVQQEIEEESDQSNGGRGGRVTVASNLPDGDAANTGGDSTAQSTRTRQRTEYELSEVVRERIKPAGQIRRISVAVLVDGQTAIDENGARVWTERSEEELEALAELVRSAMGYDAARGDTLTLRSLEFPASEPEGTEANFSIGSSIADTARPVLELGIIAGVLALLGLFVIRPLMAPKELPPLITPEALPQENITGTVEVVKAIEANTQAQELEARPPDRMDILRGAIEARRDNARTVLQGWIEMGEAPR
ncbi:MAG: flagellar basal-body MS-ring/collar protein FliF [Pseudomonadota bacterium]